MKIHHCKVQVSIKYQCDQVKAAQCQGHITVKLLKNVILFILNVFGIVVFRFIHMICHKSNGFLVLLISIWYSQYRVLFLKVCFPSIRSFDVTILFDTETEKQLSWLLRLDDFEIYSIFVHGGTRPSMIPPSFCINLLQCQGKSHCIKCSVVDQRQSRCLVCQFQPRSSIESPISVLFII